MSSWNKAKGLLGEERQFRGDTYVPYSELVRLFVGSEKSPGITGHPPDKNGGMVRGNYKFDPTMLALGDAKKGSLEAWQDNPMVAIAKATSDSANQVQTGNPQGNTVVKKSYGGKVSAMNAPIRPNHNDRLGSSYDRYDVVIDAEIDWVMNRKGVMVPVGTLKGIAWAPSMGSSQERGDRMAALIAGDRGGKAAPSRRPQPERPVQTKGDEERWAHQAAKRQAADAAASDPNSVATPDDADNGDIKMGGGGGGTNQAFRDRLAKLSKDYKAQSSFTGRPQQKAPDPEDALFWTPDKKNR